MKIKGKNSLVLAKKEFDRDALMQKWLYWIMGAAQ